jgi:predicted glycoside hydrolase/deacetylase ChbG (UPF0249 family)
VLTSASLMVLAPAAEEAALLAREHPELSVGLHFVDDGPDLDVPEHAAAAFSEQLKRFRELAGRDPTHVDSHHHVHAAGDRITTFARLVAPLGVPLRLAGPIRYVGAFYGQTRSGETSLALLARSHLVHLVATEVFDGFTELGCHPARIRGDFRSSYSNEREVELATLTAAGLREEIEQLGVTLGSYHDWALSDASRGSAPGASV